MPAEFAPHERCLIAWPPRSRTFWGEYYMLAQHSYAAVARAIARFEPVLVIARPGEGAEARSYCGSDDIEVVELPIDDSWIRDSGPIFVQRPDGQTAVADFAFNSWGERYLPYGDDARIGERLAAHLEVKRYATPMILEGGAITVDGEGTLITTESCLLNATRNPGMTKDEIEQELKDMLGVEKVIWLVSGLGLEEDPDTDGHVDGVAAFIGPARVLLHMVRDPSIRTTRTCRRTAAGSRPPTPSGGPSRSSSSTCAARPSPWAAAPSSRPTSTSTRRTAAWSCRRRGTPTTFRRSIACARSWRDARSSVCRRPSSRSAAAESTASRSRYRRPERRQPLKPGCGGGGPLC